MTGKQFREYVGKIVKIPDPENPGKEIDTVAD